MIQLISVLIIIVSILLVLVIMVQNPKGGGLSSTFGGGGGSQLFGGVRKAGDVLDRTTWVLAITLCALALMMNLSVFRSTAQEEGSAIIDRATEAPAPQQAPAFNDPAEQGGEGAIQDIQIIEDED